MMTDSIFIVLTSVFKPCYNEPLMICKAQRCVNDMPHGLAARR